MNKDWKIISLTPLPSTQVWYSKVLSLIEISMRQQMAETKRSFQKPKFIIDNEPLEQVD